MAHYLPPPPNGITTAAGVVVRQAIPRVVQVVGPGIYATGGFLVDCSAFFSSIICAVLMRTFTTLTGALPSGNTQRNALVDATAANLFATAKFNAVAVRTFSNVTPTFTGAAIGGAHSCGAVACDSSHPNTTTVPTGTVSQVAAQGFPEVNAAVDLSSTTYEFLVYGIPL